MNREFLMFDARFVEESVFAALRQRPEQRVYRRERDRIYEITDEEKREQRFDELSRRWFVRLGLADDIAASFDEQPAIFPAVQSCLVARAPCKKEEGAELFVNPDVALSERATRTLRLLLCPETLLDRRELVTLLRRELYHVVDMIDPRFGYEPTLPPALCGPAHEALLRDRYRAIWEITIEGRMSRRGWLPQSVRAVQWKQFTRMFPALGDETENHFSFFFDHEPHTHAELVAFAREPVQGAGRAPALGHRCPLCGFPTHAFEPRPEALEDAAIAAILQDFPDWRPALGLCSQCADLYRAARLSLAEAKLLPGAGLSPSRGD